MTSAEGGTASEPGEPSRWTSSGRSLWISFCETGLQPHRRRAVDRILRTGDSSGAVVQISTGIPPEGFPTSTLPPAPTTIVTTKTGSKAHCEDEGREGAARPTASPPLPPFSAKVESTASADHRRLRSGTDLGEYGLLRTTLAQTNVVSTFLDGHGATGLTRGRTTSTGPPRRPRRSSPAIEYPELVIVCIGANDPQEHDLVNGQVLVYGTQAWDNMYSSRVGGALHRGCDLDRCARALGRHAPDGELAASNAEMQHIDYLYETQVSRHKGATYLSSSSCPLGGRRQRSYDGLQERRTRFAPMTGSTSRGRRPICLAQAVIITEMDSKAYRLKLPS